MAMEDFNKLSPEQLQKLSRTIDSAKNLTNQQAEIIEKVIAGEIDVGRLRLSYLTEYFDTYSKSLDLVARKHSALNDAFLILDQKVSQEYKKAADIITEAASDIERSAQHITTSAEKLSKAKQEAEKAVVGSSDSEEPTTKKQTKQKASQSDTVENKLTITVVQKEQKQSEKPQNESEQKSETAGNKELPRDNTKETVADDIKSLLEKQVKALADVTTQKKAPAENRLAEANIEDIKVQANNNRQLSSGQQLSELVQTDKNTAVAGVNTSAAVSSQNTNLSVGTDIETQASSDAVLLADNVQLYSDYADKVTTIITAIMDLELARHVLERTEVSQVTELIINKFREITEAILTTQVSGANIKNDTNHFSAEDLVIPKQAEIAVTPKIQEPFIDSKDLITPEQVEIPVTPKIATPFVDPADIVTPEEVLISVVPHIEDLIKNEKSLENTAEIKHNTDSTTDQTFELVTLLLTAVNNITDIVATTAAGVREQTVILDKPNETPVEVNTQEDLADSLFTKLNTTFTTSFVPFRPEAERRETTKTDLKNSQTSTPELAFGLEAVSTSLETSAQNISEQTRSQARQNSELLGTFRILIDTFRELATNISTNNASAKNASAYLGGGGSDNNPPSNNTGGSAPIEAGEEESVEVGSTIADENRTVMRTEETGSIDDIIAFTNTLFDVYAKKTSDTILIATDAQTKAAIKMEDVNKRIEERKTEELKRLTALRDGIINASIDLELERQEELSNQEARIAELKLTRSKEVLDAELKAQQEFNRLKARNSMTESYSEELGQLRERESKAQDNLASMQKLEEQRIKYISKKELEAKRKHNGILREEDAKAIQKQAAEKFKLDEANLKKLTERRIKLEASKALEAERAEMRQDLQTLLPKKGNTASFAERQQAFYDLTHDEAGDKDLKKAMAAAVLAVSDLAKQLEEKIDTIAEYQSDIDTRLQGSSNKQSSGSYWNQMVKDMTKVGAINPFYKQEDFAENIRTLVKRGIAFDIEQRAFLMTIQGKIADTFNVADGTLLRLIRIQQADSTAGRLGMEAALNAFLNNMYETTEYLSDVAAGVRSSLEEMQSLMAGAEATEVEYQVQKWLGSLYSVGMSQGAVSGISQSLGQIAAGQIEGLTNGGAGNLLIMAANDADIPIADILTEGINASDTNKLLQAMVNYLAELAESSKDNNIVRQQLAEVFGVKASDLKAATNLVSQKAVSQVFGQQMSYDNMLAYLNKMAGTMGDRTSLAEKLTNFWENGQYTLAGSIASNPAAYFIYKMAKVLDDAVGGIDLPFVNVMGFGVDLNTTVSDLMRVAATSAGIISSIGPLISGIGNSFSGRSMLQALGIGSGSGLTTTPRGGSGLTDYLSSSKKGSSSSRGVGDSGSRSSSLGSDSGSGGGSNVSGSGYVGNASSSDIKNSTIQGAEDDKKQLMVEAKEEEPDNKVDFLNATVLKIYELLDDVAHGSGYFRVKVEGYGLNSASGNSSGAIGGVSALDRPASSPSNNGLSSNSPNINSGGSSSGGGNDLGSAGGDVNGNSDSSSGFGNGNVSLGGWTTLL